MRRENYDGFLVTNLTNVRYLSGFTGSNGTILMLPDGAIFLTDGRYRTQAADEVQGLPVKFAVNKSLPRQLKPLVPSCGSFRLGFESDVVTVVQHGFLLKELRSNVVLEPTHSVVQKLRLHKDSEEVATIREAAQITVSAFGAVLELLKPGMTERQVQRMLRTTMEDMGAEGEAFETIVLFGKRTCLVHGKPSDYPLHKNELVLMDFGARYQGYCSDFTRTFSFGRATRKAADSFEVVRKALQKAASKAKSGTACSKMDIATREHFRKTGREKEYLHALGHGVGLEIHEAPRLNIHSNSVLSPDMVITIEPGLYSRQWGGIRLENLYLVKKEGLENLTPDPIVLER